MKEENLSTLTDQELLDEAKKMKSSAIMHALLIGIMIGIVIYGFAKSNLGFFALIPLFFAFKVFHNPENNKKYKVLRRLLKERNLE
jgi:hypothetical protein